MNNENGQMNQGVNPQNMIPNSQPVQNNNVDILDANVGQVVPEQPVVENPGLGEQPVAPVVNSTPQQNDFVGQDAAQSVPQQNDFMGQSVPQQNDFVGQNIGQNMPQPSFNEVAPQIQPQVVQEKKTAKKGVSILGVVLISIIVAGLSILGTLYLTNSMGGSKKSSSSSNNTSANSNNSNNQSEDKKEDEKKEESKKVASGTDKNTSGKTILDTITATVVLNKESYDVKTELLQNDGFYTKNVYINGYMFINNQPVRVNSPSEDSNQLVAQIKNVLNDELQSMKVLKDSTLDAEYLAYLEKNGDFVNYTSVASGTSYLYLVNAGGQVIGKIESDVHGNGFAIETNNLPTITNYKENTTGEYKYSLYADNRYVSFENGFIYIIDNVMDSISRCDTGACAVSEYKITIKNGEMVKEASKTYDSAQGYKMQGAGAR